MLDPLKLQALTKPAEIDKMVFIPGGMFMMGSDKFYPEEKPVNNALMVSGWINAH